MTKKVIIIGAGLGGLASASLLSKAGYQVEIYEQLNYAGGRVAILKDQGYQFDLGPSWYLMPEVFEHFFELMGQNVNDYLDIIKLDPAYKVFFDNDPPVEIVADQSKNIELFESIEAGAGQKLIEYTNQSIKIYDLALKYFLYNNFSTPKDFINLEILKNSLKLLRLAAISYDREVSRFFKDKRLKMILEYSAVFLGASPFKTPAIYTLMSAIDYRGGVFYPKGGIMEVANQIAKLAKDSGVKIHLNQPVKKINIKSNIAQGITLNSGKFVPADIVISNADLHFTETKLLSKKYQTYPISYWEKRNPGPSALMIYLGVKSKLPNLDHHNLLFVDEWKENFESIYETKTVPEHASIYLSKATVIDPQYAPKNHSALVALVPLPAGLKLKDEQYESLADKYIDDIEKMTKIKNFKNKIVYKKLMTPNEFGSRYNSWMLNSIGPAHTLAQTAIFRTGNKSKKVSNLYYTGGFTIPGVGMPMVLISAEMIYKKIVGDKSTGPVNKIERIY